MKRHILTGCIFLLVVPLLLTACQPPDPNSNSNCNYAYDQITDHGRTLHITSRVLDYLANGGQTQLNATKVTTVTISADFGITADLAIVAGVNAQLHLSAGYSVATTVANSQTIQVPPGPGYTGIMAYLWKMFPDTFTAQSAEKIMEMFEQVSR